MASFRSTTGSLLGWFDIEPYRGGCWLPGAQGQSGPGAPSGACFSTAAAAGRCR